MTEPLSIGIVGDFDPAKPSHEAINRSLAWVAADLSLALKTAWTATPKWESADPSSLGNVHGLLGASGSPYMSEAGALRAIRLAREHGVPYLGTCGGFQHMILEFSRHVLGWGNATHEENAPGGAQPVVVALACSLKGATGTVRLLPESRAAALYGKEEEVEESFNCRYGFDDRYRTRLEERGLRVTGLDPDGAARIIELPSHPFFLGTLFQPQLRSQPGSPHPVLAAFLRAAHRHAAVGSSKPS